MIVIKFTGALTSQDQIIIERYNLKVASSKSLSGGELIVDILIPLIPIVIEQLGAIVKEIIKGKKGVTIKTKDIEIKNVEHDKIDEIINKILDKKNNT